MYCYDEDSETSELVCSGTHYLPADSSDVQSLNMQSIMESHLCMNFIKPSGQEESVVDLYATNIDSLSFESKVYIYDSSTGNYTYENDFYTSTSLKITLYQY